MRKWTIIQIMRPYKGDANVLEECFLVISHFQTQFDADTERKSYANPDWFIIIETW